MTETIEDIQKTKDATFTCPDCGELDQDDVVFLCNHCTQEELIHENGMYMCPACLVPGENFQCMKCDSKGVTMTVAKSKKS